MGCTMAVSTHRSEAKLKMNFARTWLLQVEGVFSGTLSYIFNSFVEGTSFSGIVAEAKAAGFTEPDPRDDLAGMDVARKVTILARWGAVW